MTPEVGSLPVIDLSKFPTEKDKLAAAVETSPGCFRVVNHGIPVALTAEMKATAAFLLDLPLEVKLQNTDVVPGTGYIKPYRLNPLYEALGVYDAASLEDMHAFFSRLGVPPRHREIFSAYVSKLHDLITQLASEVAMGLGLVDFSFQEWSCFLRLNRYNFTEDPVGSLGLQGHTDAGFITILLEDVYNDGLEIMDSTGNYVSIDPVPDTFLVFMGDIAKVWSNGRLHAAMHRVVCKKAEPRITVAFFMLAPKDNKIETRAELVDSKHPSLYNSFDYMEYRERRTSSLALAGEVIRRWARNQDATV